RRYGHKLGPVSIEDLFTIARPEHVHTPLGGNLPLTTRPGIGPHVDLRLAGFIGAIGDPPSVGGELRPSFRKTGLEEWMLRLWTVYGIDPDIEARLRIPLDCCNEFAVRRERTERKRLRLTDPVSRNRPRALSVATGAKRYAFTVACP